MSPELSIGELAEAAGVSRRAVRFYVQQRLLPAPQGRGRGRHYDQTHLERLQRIAGLQGAGHSLEAIRRILENGEAGEAESGEAGEAASLVPSAPPRRVTRAGLSAQLWTRLRLGEGVELHYDAARHNPTIEQLMRLRDSVRAVFQDGREPGPAASDASGEQSNNGT